MLCGVLTDLTEQKQHLHGLAETNTPDDRRQERERVEEALRHSQKIEAAGQLKGRPWRLADKLAL